MGRWLSRESEGSRESAVTLNPVVIKRIHIAGLCFVAGATFARSQLVQTVPLDPPYCEKQEFEPNYRLPQDGKISGRVLDQNGAPLQDSPVELRLYLTPIKQLAVAKVMTNREGKFNFRRVKAGRYRIVPVPTRLFQQTSQGICEGDDCRVEITLRPNPTGTPDSQCPVH